MGRPIPFTLYEYKGEYPDHDDRNPKNFRYMLEGNVCMEPVTQIDPATVQQVLAWCGANWSDPWTHDVGSDYVRLFTNSGEDVSLFKLTHGFSVVFDMDQTYADDDYEGVVNEDYQPFQ